MDIFQVDAFTDRPFSGNPAAICPLTEVVPDVWMQNVAAEMNLAETAFLLRRGAIWNLRWFTPLVEVDLCGHATLAAAHVMWETGLATPAEPLVFETRSGRLEAVRRGEWIRLDFPALPMEDTEPPDGLVEALGFDPVSVVRSRFDYLLQAESEAVLRSLSPDFQALGKVDCRGVIVTSAAEDEGFDFISRFFAPQVGINEDPVTGSAHCVLAPYWSERTGKTLMTAYQASPRGGVVGVECDGDRVFLEGRAVTVLKGSLLHRPGA